MEQRIQFCSTADGTRIAYATMGQGPALVFPAGWISHLGLAWEWPALRSFFQALARHHTFVTYDRPGCGLSDPNRTEYSLEAEAQTLETVVDHLKLKRFTLFGVSLGGPIAIAYAVKHPRRLSHLILYGTYARGDAIAKEEVATSFVSLIRAHWGVGSKTLTDIFIPGSDADAHAWWTRYQRESATAEMAAQLLEMIYRIDVTGLLPRVRVPTVVMHRERDRAMPFRAGREVAALLPNARFIPLEGNIHLPWLGDSDSVLRVTAEFLGEPASAGAVEQAEQPVAQGTAVAAHEPGTGEASSLIAALDLVALSRFRVVGSYTRYDEAVRNTLKDVRQKIAAAFDRPSRKRENYLLWAAPGSGKTYLVQQVAASLSKDIRYCELNLAKHSEQEFISALSQLDGDGEPYLCLVDEVDAKPNEAWPYEVLLPYLDAATERGAPCVFVLAGSSGSSVVEMKRLIASRPKGTDLLSRIPSVNEYEISPMGLGDRVLVVLSQFKQAGQEIGREVRAVEKLGLYYVALSSHLGNARQLREFAVRAVERVPTGEDRVKYDHLFSAGDPENKAFWMQAVPVTGDLANRFVTLEH